MAYLACALGESPVSLWCACVIAVAPHYKDSKVLFICILYILLMYFV